MPELPYKLEVTCVKKPHRDSSHEAITHLGGPDWYGTCENVVQAIERNWHSFFTDDGGKEAQVVVRANTATGTKYVQTRADGVWKNNLLALRECS